MVFRPLGQVVFRIHWLAEAPHEPQGCTTFFSSIRKIGRFQGAFCSFCALQAQQESIIIFAVHVCVNVCVYACSDIPLLCWPEDHCGGCQEYLFYIYLQVLDGSSLHYQVSDYGLHNQVLGWHNSMHIQMLGTNVLPRNTLNKLFPSEIYKCFIFIPAFKS